MKRDEFFTTLKLLNVKEHGNEYRIKGFLFEYTPTPIIDYVLLKGRIPYSLAKTIYAQHKKYGLNDYYFKIPYEDENHPIEKLYITQIKIESIEALQFVVKTIREHPFINEWAIGNN